MLYASATDLRIVRSREFASGLASCAASAAARRAASGLLSELSMLASTTNARTTNAENSGFPFSAAASPRNAWIEFEAGVRLFVNSSGALELTIV